MKVLIIDDEEMIRNLASKVLTKAGYKVELFDSGQAAITSLESEPENIGVALIDQTMQGLTGFETLRRLREIKPGLPGIISSGMALKTEDIPDDLRERVHLLQKPYRAGELTETVSEAIGGNRKH